MAEINRLVWEKGDFGAIAPMIWDVGDVVVGHADVQSGERVLDVACGTGNAALRAAERGAQVTGLDIVPALLDQGRKLAADAGVEIEFVEGDAENLPFDDGSFDVVLSTFGCMFAPDHRLVAAEIARVLRPGGRIAIASWTPEGVVGQLFKVTAGHLPSPPDGFQPPVLWGNEDHVRELFAGEGVEPRFAREETNSLAYESAEEGVSLFETKFGPVVTAKEALEPEGKWEAMRTDMLAFFGEHRDDGAEYLVAMGTKGG